MADKWYVNLEKYDSKKRHGTHVKLEAAIKPASKTSDMCDWQVAPVGTDNTDVTYIATAARAHLEHAQTAQINAPGTAKHRKFENKLHFPHVGGDTYEVSCSMHSDPLHKNLLKQEFITWRKIFYVLNYVNEDCESLFDAAMAGVKKVYAASFIELVETSRKATRVAEKATEAKTTNLQHLYSPSDTPLTHKPFHLRVIMVNDIHDSTDVDVIETLDHDTDVNAGDCTIAVSHDDSDDSWNVQLDFNEALSSSWKDDKPTGPALQASVVDAGATVHHGPVDIKAFVSLSGDRRLLVKLKNSSTTAQFHRAFERNKAGEDRKVQLDFAVGFQDTYCGHSRGNFVCIRINEQGDLATLKRSVLQTLVHEIGHACQAVKQREPQHDGGGAAVGWYDNDRHYTQHGGQGPHCKLNAVCSHPMVATSEYNHDGGAGKLCVMFHRDDPEVYADGRFCNRCRDILKRTNLGKAEMEAKEWDLYD